MCCPRHGGGVQFHGFDVEEERDPGIVPAGMGWEAGRGGAYFNGFGGVGAAGEVEPVAKGGGVVKEPGERGGDDEGGQEPEDGGAQLTAAGEGEADGEPGEERP